MVFIVNLLLGRSPSI